MYTDESGFLYLAGKERFAFVSAEYQSLWDWSGGRDTVGSSLTALVRYMLDKYPISGFLADSRVTTTLNNEFTHTIWLCKNADGVPMVGFGFIDSIIHCLYAGYADIAWNFFKHYSRDLDTGAIEYDPYVR